jgi:ribonuclease HII
MPDDELESALHARGLKWVAGVDEAGRGPLAGPVAAAAVILPRGFACPGLVSPEEIDRINILRATHLAMRQAVEQLARRPDHCLIDGLPVKEFPISHDGIVKGDGKSLSIAAASIVAKVTRDRRMQEIDIEFPQFGFSRHQGYGTKEHLEALRIHGPCRHHRRSFQPVAQLTLPFDGA